MNNGDSETDVLDFVYPRNKEKRKKRREHARKLKGEKYTRAMLGSSVREVLKYDEGYDSKAYYDSHSIESYEHVEKTRKHKVLRKVKYKVLYRYMLIETGA